MADPTGHVWVDGRLLGADETHLSVFDRGFQLGDGVFETLRASGGHVTELPDHLARLRRSADGLEIPLPADIDTQLTAAITELLEADGLAGPGADASIRITVSRGLYRTRGVLPPDEGVPATVAVQAWPVVDAPASHISEGLHLVVSAVRRDPRDPLATLKTTSRAEYVYARLEARRSGADDALFLTVDGHCSESTSANLFLIRTASDGVDELVTPSLECAILPGTTRSWLLGWAPTVDLRPVESTFGPDIVGSAREAFLSSSVAGILPVTRFEGRPIGDGRPGALTLRARSDRESMIRAGGAP
jgi:branched-chain amino acid aminotransferase